jgi:hypothetical protein
MLVPEAMAMNKQWLGEVSILSPFPQQKRPTLFLASEKTWTESSQFERTGELPWCGVIWSRDDWVGRFVGLAGWPVLAFLQFLGEGPDSEELPHRSKTTHSNTWKAFEGICDQNTSYRLLLASKVPHSREFHSLGHWPCLKYMRKKTTLSTIGFPGYLGGHRKRGRMGQGRPSWKYWASELISQKSPRKTLQTSDCPKWVWKVTLWNTASNR